MNNKEVAKGFVKNHLKENDTLNGSNMIAISQNKINVIYSYGTHFPIAMKLKDGYYLFNGSKYSPTTSRHKSIVLKEIKEDVSDEKMIIFMPTNKFKEVINEEIDSYKELIMRRIVDD
jgi:uncharacterized protein YfeS